MNSCKDNDKNPFICKKCLKLTVFEIEKRRFKRVHEKLESILEQAARSEGL